MKTYPGLIATVCATERTAQLVSRAIPILVRWAQSGVTTNTYGDLIRELGMVKFSGIGYTLGCIEDVISALRKKIGEQISDILDFSDYEIAEVVEKCMEEDIEAVQKRRTP